MVTKFPSEKAVETGAIIQLQSQSSSAWIVSLTVLLLNLITVFCGILTLEPYFHCQVSLHFRVETTGKIELSGSLHPSQRVARCHPLTPPDPAGPMLGPW